MRLALMAAGAALLWSAASLAQDYQQDNIIVTATRNTSKYYSEDKPVIGLRRRADFAALPVAITSDSRDEKVRRDEVHAMMLAAIERASASGVELVYGDNDLRAITRENYRELKIEYGGRADTSELRFFVQRSLAGSANDAEAVIERYMKSVTPRGRSLIEPRGKLTLTIVGPDQYRDDVVRLVAAEANKNAAFFGAGYAVEVEGLDRDLVWSQLSASDVFLYIPYRFTIVPR